MCKNCILLIFYTLYMIRWTVKPCYFVMDVKSITIIEYSIQILYRHHGKNKIKNVNYWHTKLFLCKSIKYVDPSLFTMTSNNKYKYNYSQNHYYNILHITYYYKFRPVETIVHSFYMITCIQYIWPFFKLV